MKSIKKEANEYAKDCLLCQLSQNAPNVHFEIGAYYALDVIEGILPKEDKNLNEIGKALLWRIKDTIEQLRSNQ